MAGDGWGWLGMAGDGWESLGIAGDGWGLLGKAGDCWDGWGWQGWLGIAGDGSWATFILSKHFCAMTFKAPKIQKRYTW